MTTLNVYLVEYHTFELKDSQQKGATLNHTHFVGKLTASPCATIPSVRSNTKMSTMVTSAAMGIAELNEQYELSFIMAVGLIILLFRSNLTKPHWQIVDDDEGIASLRRKLWKEGLFGHCFKELIFMSRRNNSHRTQL